MIVYEDRELEAMVLSGGSCIAVPFEIFVPESGERQITVYSCFAKIAEKYENMFADSLLSTDALNWLDQKIYADVKMFGYEHCYDDIHMMMEFQLSELSQLCKFDDSDVEFINNDSELYDIDASLIEGLNIDDGAAIIIKDGKLVSVSCINDVSFDDGSVEIFVETDSEYRNRGFGTSTVYSIAKKYLEKGVSVRFKCAKTNNASINLAKKCGFVKTRGRYSYVCFAIDEN